MANAPDFNAAGNKDPKKPEQPPVKPAQPAAPKPRPRPRPMDNCPACGRG